MWIKLSKYKDFYLFEKRPPPDTTFEDFAREHKYLLKQAIQEKREKTYQVLKQRIKRLTPEQAADILDKVRLIDSGKQKSTGFAPRTMADWLDNPHYLPWLQNSACTTKCVTTPCATCSTTDFWRIDND